MPDKKFLGLINTPKTAKNDEKHFFAQNTPGLSLPEVFSFADPPPNEDSNGEDGDENDDDNPESCQDDGSVLAPPLVLSKPPGSNESQDSQPITSTTGGGGANLPIWTMNVSENSASAFQSRCVNPPGVIQYQHIKGSPGEPPPPPPKPLFIQEPLDLNGLDDDDSSATNNLTQSTNTTPETSTGGGPKKKTRGRVKINIELIKDKERRSTTFSKRKTGIFKKAQELATLTDAQVMLLVASETGHVYTFATHKLQPIITGEDGIQLITACLHTPAAAASSQGQQHEMRGGDRGMNGGGESLPGSTAHTALSSSAARHPKKRKLEDLKLKNPNRNLEQGNQAPPPQHQHRHQPTQMMRIEKTEPQDPQLSNSIPQNSSIQLINAAAAAAASRSHQMMADQSRNLKIPTVFIPSQDSESDSRFIPQSAAGGAITLNSNLTNQQLDHNSGQRILNNGFPSTFTLNQNQVELLFGGNSEHNQHPGGIILTTDPSHPSLQNVMKQLYNNSSEQNQNSGQTTQQNIINAEQTLFYARPPPALISQPQSQGTNIEQYKIMTTPKIS